MMLTIWLLSPSVRIVNLQMGWTDSIKIGHTHPPSRTNGKELEDSQKGGEGKRLGGVLLEMQCSYGCT